MTPVLHADRPRELLTGRRPRDFGAHRTCARCHNNLRRTNPGPLCDPCTKARRAAEFAAEEEGHMREKVHDAAVVEWLREHPGWHTRREVCEAVGVPHGSQTAVFWRLCDEDGRVYRTADGHLYADREWYVNSDEYPTPQNAPAPQQAPAPVAPPEPAPDAPEPDPAAEAVQAPAPGVTVNGASVQYWVDGTVELTSPEGDPEVVAIGACVDALGGLDRAARRRALRYLFAREDDEGRE